MIHVFGSINVDFVCRVKAFARPGETVVASAFARTHGGKGANQAVAAARALEAHGAVRMVGAVGQELLGEEALDNLRREGVGVDAVARVSEATGMAFITIDAGGENLITVAAGANWQVEAAFRAGVEATSRGDIAVMQMEVPPAETLATARSLRARGVRTLLNVAPVPHDLDAATLDALLSATDILIVNEHELSALAAILGRGNATLEEAASGVCAHKADLVLLVTLGRRGTLLREPGAAPLALPALAVDAVDTTGAGDTFVGVFAASLQSGHSLPEAARRAARAGSLACRRFGAQSAMPSRHEIETAAQGGAGEGVNAV